MTKIVLDTVSSGYNLGKINANFEKLETELNNKVLYRDQTSTPNEPNELEQDLDLNSNRILNLPAPVAPTEPLRKGDIVSDATGATVQYVDDSIVAAVDEATDTTVPLNIINDLSQAYDFTTVAAFKASAISFPDGKVIHLLDRDTDYIKATGIGSGDDGDVIDSTTVNQNIVLDNHSVVSTRNYGAVSGQDNTTAYKAALATGKNTKFTENSTISSPLHLRYLSSAQGEAGVVLAVGAGVELFKSQLSDETTPVDGLSNKTTYSHLGNIYASGPGKALNGTVGIHLDGDVNHAWNVFQNVRCESMETGYKQSGGWNNITMACDFRACINGALYEGSEIQAGWAGSGQTSIGCQYSFNTTGINESGVPWMNTHINPIMEGNTLGFDAQGQSTILISPWWESNTDNFFAKRGFTQIG
jgi:hypothetical protein